MRPLLGLILCLLLAGLTGCGEPSPDCEDAPHYAARFQELDPDDQTGRAAVHDLYNQALAACDR